MLGREGTWEVQTRGCAAREGQPLLPDTAFFHSHTEKKTEIGGFQGIPRAYKHRAPINTACPYTPCAYKYRAPINAASEYQAFAASAAPKLRFGQAYK